MFTHTISNVVQSLVRFLFILFIADVIKKYSNFVGVPIYLNGKKVNVIQVNFALFYPLRPP